ncbi:DUF2141 domain-containing protein [Lacihabitans sp. CCS-44]|uniref:DUF2141 domain-containing protein n=1 Tax=Lacihabitans sp. CCS-44 TaxID=2487331 RepID=UPI0020CC370C|nr:DUF2141 domain-containing protein [Lacihabitans sp. CCS-44]MCP9756828.1 DUF2141 domain-containing protein [Lacihabitans sp. CCS-44]
MKKYFSILFLFVALRTWGEDTPKVSVKITNIKQVKGSIRVAFYKKGCDFPNEGSITFAKEVKITQIGEMTIHFSEVPFGEYAIAVFQDKNQNQKIDKNLVGYPLEPFGFSRNFKPKFSGPDFSDCNVVISPTTNTFTIKMID